MSGDISAWPNFKLGQVGHEDINALYSGNSRKFLRNFVVIENNVS